MKPKRWKKLLAGTLAFGMILPSVAWSGKAVPVQAQETSSGTVNEATEWEELSAILDSYPGIYTEDTKLAEDWSSSRTPDGPLMGNGTVYAYMQGDQRTQNLYISHSNMWQDESGEREGQGQKYTTFGGISIQKCVGENIALNKNVTVSSQTKDSESGACMVDGSTGTKWCTTPSDNGGVDDYYWAVVDLGESRGISRWVVRHAQAGGETSEFNTKDFKLQYYDGEGTPDGAVDADWKDADAVTGNTEATTDRNLETPVTARYVRLLITKATGSDNNAVRIPEFELYAEPGTVQEDAQEFQYVQDMKNAEVTAQSKDGFTTVNWLSAKENILVTEITNITKSNLSLNVTAWTSNDNTTALVDGKTMIATKAGISEPNEDWPFADGTWEGWTVNIAMASRVIGDVEVTTENIDNHKNSSVFVLAPGQKVTVVSAIEGGKQEGDEENTHEQAIAKATTKLETRLNQDALDTSKQKHREYWKNYWLKSYIDIQDEEVERMYYGMLYQLGCATSTSSENNGGTPAGLFPWTAADRPSWKGDYTTNTDFQRQIHPLMTANRTEGIENYLNIIEQFWPDAVRRAESVQDLNWLVEKTGRPLFTQGIEGGALFPTHIGPWGAATERNYSHRDYWSSPADATAVLMPVIKEWKYTLDEELLERLYPLMKSVSVFWENYVTLEDGKYVVYGATHEDVPGRNAILDVDACKYMLKNTILAANELNVDQDKVEIWQNILDNMSPVPTFIYNGKETICDVEGRTQSNTGSTFNSNPVTIQSVYYYDSIGMTASDEEKEKYFNYLEVENGKASHRRLISATRLGYDINEIMGTLKSSSINANPGYDYGMRGNNTIGDIGKVANIAIVQDSLIQSNEGFINIFANWFDNQETSFKRLRTENAFLVDADMNQFGQVTYVNIHSEKGRDCSVLNPWPGQEMEVYENGKKIEIKSTEENSLGTVYIFATKAGADYELREAIPEDVETNTQLKVLSVSGLSMTPAFDRNITDYELTLPADSQEVTVVAIPVSPEATVKVNGQSIEENDRMTLATQKLSNIQVEVISADGKNEATYTIKLKHTVEIKAENGKIVMVAPSEIRYTLDGNAPSRISRIYDQPISLPTKELTVQAAAFIDGEQVSDLVTFEFDGTNIALHKPVWSTENQPGNLPEHLTDGKMDTRWGSLESVTADKPAWVLVDLGKVYDIEKFVTTFYANNRSYQYEIYTSESDVEKEELTKESFTLCVDKKSNESTEMTVTDIASDGTKGRYVAIYFVGSKPEKSACMWEFEVYGPETEEEVVDKTALKEALAKAEKAKEDGSYDAAYEDMRKVFDEYLEIAKAVDANDKSDSYSVESATEALLVAIEGLKEEVKVTEVQKFDAMEVAFGTSFEELALPETVMAALSNAKTVDIPVSWEEEVYNADKSGEYTIIGTLQLPAGVSNPDNHTATVTVKVNAPITAKELLQKTYDYALKLSTDGATASAREYFEKAKANAKAVLDNPDATQEAINQAWDDLVDAIHGLGVVKGDLTYLKILIDKAESMMADKDKYVTTNWQKLVDELAEGKAVYNDGDALQEDIDKAVDELLEAILIQRYKANKDNLKELIEKADNMDLSGYTKESVTVLKNALTAAKAVMADESLSVDDQNKVDLAEKELNDAIKGLVKASNDNTGNNGNTGSDGKTDAPKTGDTFHVMFWLAGMLAAMVTVYVIVQRRVKRGNK